MGWLRRLFAAPPSLKEVSQRLEDVEGDVAFLAQQLRKLRGRLTGSIRHEEAPSEAAEALEAPPLPVGVSPAVWSRLDPAARERLLARKAAQRVPGR